MSKFRMYIVNFLVEYNYYTKPPYKIFETKKNTIVFSHFMVINALVAELTKSDTLLCFYPDYTSITKIIVEDNKVKDLYIGNERKTLINL